MLHCTANQPISTHLAISAKLNGCLSPDKADETRKFSWISGDFIKSYLNLAISFKSQIKCSASSSRFLEWFVLNVCSMTLFLSSGTGTIFAVFRFDWNSCWSAFTGMCTGKDGATIWKLWNWYSVRRNHRCEGKPPLPGGFISAVIFDCSGAYYVAEK